MKPWLEGQLGRVPPGSGLAEATRYALARWPALCRFLDDARVAALRSAFVSVTKDARFLEAAKRRRFPIDPIDGETVQRLVNDICSAPGPLKALAKAALTGK